MRSKDGGYESAASVARDRAEEMEPPREELGDNPYRQCSECGHQALKEGAYFGMYGLYFVCAGCPEEKEQDDE